MKIASSVLVPLLLATAITVRGRPTDPPTAGTAAATNAKPAFAKAPGLFDDTIVAKGKDVQVQRGQLDAEFIRTKTAYTSRGQMAPPDLESMILDNLIRFKLILAKATDADKAAGKELFQKNMQKAKEESKLSDAEFNDRLNRQLLLQDVTKEQWEKQQIEQATVQTTLQRELKIQVTDEDVQKYYKDNPPKFEVPEMVRVSHILLTTRDTATSTELPEDKKAAKRKLAEDLVKRARAGEDFAKLAKEYSEDPGSKDNGGEYTFARGRMVPEFEVAAFSLKTNEVSDVVTTQFGYHIIKLSEKLPAKTAKLEEVAPKIKEFLTAQEIQKAAAPYVEQLKAAAKVEILDERLKAASNNLGLPAAHPAAKTGDK